MNKLLLHTTTRRMPQKSLWGKKQHYDSKFKSRQKESMVEQSSPSLVEGRGDSVGGGEGCEGSSKVVSSAPQRAHSVRPSRSVLMTLTFLHVSCTLRKSLPKKLLPDTHGLDWLYFAPTSVGSNSPSWARGNVWNGYSCYLEGISFVVTIRISAYPLTLYICLLTSQKDTSFASNKGGF